MRTPPENALPGRLADAMAAELAFARDPLTEHGPKELPRPPPPPPRRRPRRTPEVASRG
ncbi:hypothetical protein ACWC3X_26460 [Streptomyces populi]